jgi:hypothetical protein
MATALKVKHFLVLKNQLNIWPNEQLLHLRKCASTVTLKKYTDVEPYVTAIIMKS